MDRPASRLPGAVCDRAPGGAGRGRDKARTVVIWQVRRVRVPLVTVRRLTGVRFAGLCVRVSLVTVRWWTGGKASGIGRPTAAYYVGVRLLPSRLAK